MVDPASIAMPRRRRRAKTDRIDGETLLRALLAYKRGEPRVCAMVVAPTPEEEDRRRLCRERETLIAERVQHVNRIKGLLFAQGISDYEPLRRNRRARLEELRTGDGRALPSHLKAQIGRELDRIELLLEQIKAVEAERDALLAAARACKRSGRAGPGHDAARLEGNGRQLAAVLWSEAFYRQFANRRQVAAYAGLAATPWQSGGIRHEQGVSKAGNPTAADHHDPARLAVATSSAAVSPDALVPRAGQARKARKRAIVALARKLLVALWKYVTQGVVIEGAVMKTAA